MRRASAQLQTDRRQEILDAAQHCFARSGFHQASMQEICAEAQISPGGLYRYFGSKEEIIAGIAERDRADVAEHFRELEQAPDFFEAIAASAGYYLVERPLDEIVLCAEIMAESRRNHDVARIHAGIESDVKNGLIDLLRSAAQRGVVRSDLDFTTAAAVLMALVDGFAWRRAADPTFDAKAALPFVLDMIRTMLTAKESV
jgi:TetR/AcrR family transcriptional repressor of uid operon